VPEDRNIMQPEWTHFTLQYEDYGLLDGEKREGEDFEITTGDWAAKMKILRVQHYFLRCIVMQSSRNLLTLWRDTLHLISDSKK
jgi:hypothetical protein